MKSVFALAPALLLAVGCAIGCASAVDTPPPNEEGCRTCHGSNKSPAPPRALNGSTDPADPGVGAHDAHLFGLRLQHPVSCGECHLRPEHVDDPGHLDDTPGAELIFGALASQETTPEWRANELTCANTYCHGTSTPTWNKTDGSQVACGSCHGMPPPAPHPPANDCALCHAPVAGRGQTIALPERHIDGVLDVADKSQCFGCHGSSTNFAPPKDLQGENSTDSITVGAHQSHLSGGSFSKAVECATCHVVPEKLEDPGHIDQTPHAEVRPAVNWNRGDATCANTTCHLESTPVWNVVDGTQAKCGSCHGLPPPAPHPESDHCEICHLPTAGPDKTIANRATHVDGTVQVSTDSCTGCHGSALNLAPPPDSSMNNDLSRRSVGAHQTHLSGGQFSVAVACDTCHVVPLDVQAPGHLDTPLPAEVTFSGLARAGNSAPMYDAAGGSCAGTYCHGTNAAPSWTKVDGSQNACGSCHGLPPPAPHPAADRCQNCHAPTAGPDKTIANRATHVDGILQVSDGTCTDCHGGLDSPAPPNDTMMHSELALPSVGAHRAHVMGQNSISRPVACSECHLVPMRTDDPGHIDTPLPAELTWGPLATNHGATPMFDEATSSCSDVYCHGSTLPDGVLTQPTWTILDGSQSACGSCHGAPPAAPHPNDTRCELCHLPTAGSNMIIANPATHIDGVLQVAAQCDSCHGNNGVSAPPRDLDGAIDRALPTIGAHEVHLSGGTVSKAVQCNQCHVIPLNIDDPGHRDTPRPAELTFGTIAAFGSTPIYARPTCSDTYCHSGAGAAMPNPTWNDTSGSQAQCGGCHGLPPPTQAHQNVTDDCSVCHLPTAGPNNTIANRNTHVDGILQVTGLGCTSCHGDMTSAAPPRDLAGLTASDQIGAHRAHLSGGSFSSPVPCSSCHVVPVDVNSPGHLDTPPPAEITFSGRASGTFATPTFDASSLSCNNTYCHGDTPMVWNAPGTATCGSCHDLPPPAPHPQMEDCTTCHAPVAGPNQTIADRNRHADGVVDVVHVTACETCHGTAANPAPPQDLNGLNTSAQVGAHRAHLNGTGDSLAVPCTECHVAVTNVDQAGHYDTARPAELSFGVLASQSSTPRWQNSHCNNTYCHGSTLPGGTSKNPAWTDGAQPCTACHGMPPPDAQHGNGTATQCEGCHPDTAGPGQTIINAARHVDGVVDTSATCDACHGQNGDPMPPRDLAGLNASDQVGAHQVHRNPANSSPVACTTCHLVPATYSAPGHADTPSPAEVILGGRASLDATTPSFAPATFTCSNTYCHGATLAGGKTNVTWNDADHSESQCGACHGMPPATPAHNGQGANSCNSCHVDDAGPNQTITDPTLHLDGVVQVRGGGCDACHGSPPAPGRESYNGSAGAHATHATTLGFECATCHGNNGSGPQHNQGNGTVTRANVNIVFDASRTFAGGTTMGNATYTSSSKTCAVGCHNPKIGNPPETQNVSNTVTWAGGSVACRGCHDQVQNSLPRNHDISAQGDAGCTTCHDMTGHTGGVTAMLDPDPTDSFSFSAANKDNLCKTCHDGGGGTAFGNRTAPNVSALWTTSMHGARGYTCSDCHAYHSSTSSGPLFIDRASQTCMASGCHANLSTDFGQASGVISHHRIEGGTGIQLACINCHNPHVAQANPLSVSDPDSKYTLMSIPASARTSKKSSGDYRAFCLRCHDGAPPAGVQGALNINTALSTGVDPSQFKSGSTSLHKSKHSGFNCQNCHLDHGSPGSGGTNRGRLLRSFISVSSFPYRGEGSCSTGNGGNSFGCH